MEARKAQPAQGVMDAKTKQDYVGEDNQTLYRKCIAEMLEAIDDERRLRAISVYVQNHTQAGTAQSMEAQTTQSNAGMDYRAGIAALAQRLTDSTAQRAFKIVEQIFLMDEPEKKRGSGARAAD